MASLVLTAATQGGTTAITPTDQSGTITCTLPSTGGTLQTSGAGFTANGVAYASSTSALTTGSALSFSGTQLGIVGSTSSSSGIVTALKLQNTGTATNDGARILFTSGTSTEGASIGSGGKALNSANLIFNTGGNNARMTIDQDGNVGIGTSTPGLPLDVIGQARATALLVLNAGTPTTPGNTTPTFFSPSSGVLGLVNNGAESLRVNSNGSLLIGTTTVVDGSGAALVINTSYPKTRIEIRNDGESGGLYAITFRNSNGLVGSIVTNGSATSYNTSSDYRLKNTIAPMTGALAKVALLKPVTYKWNVDGSDSQGFIAHELQAVVPECVHGSKDEVDADGKPQYQGIDTSFLVATLTSAIQELNTLITAQQSTIQSLTERITALEGART